MSVVLSNEEVGPCRRKLRVEIPAAAVAEERQRVLGTFRRGARVPGFRPGKAPARLVEQRFGEDIREQVVDQLLPRYWRQAEAEAGIEPLLPPRVSDVEVEAGEPLTFTATVEVRPAIEIGNATGFDLPEVESEPTGEEVAAALDDLRRAWADWRPAERPAARGDLVEAHISELEAAGDEGGEEVVVGEPRPVRFEIGHPSVWEELSLAATGQQAGGTVEFTRREGEAPPRAFRAAIEAVREQDLPELDDALAQRAHLPDLAALRHDVTERLRRGKQLEARRKREQAMLEQLCQRHPLELPQWVVDQEVESLVNDYAHELVRQGVDIERSEIEWSDIARQVRPQAERRVQARLLLDAVAAEAGIRVSETEVEGAVAALARSQNRPAPALRRELAEAGKLTLLRDQIGRDKAVRHLLGEGPAQGDVVEAEDTAAASDVDDTDEPSSGG